MRARDYAPPGPLAEAPTGPFVDRHERLLALYDAMGGVELGGHDRDILGWMAASLHDPTLRTIVSLVLRVRDFERDQAAAMVAGLRAELHDGRINTAQAVAVLADIERNLSTTWAA